MSPNLKGLVAVVTGASSGIGASTARALAGEGAAVALLARRQGKLTELADELDTATSVHAVDVSDREAMGHTIDEVFDTHGGIDVLINNAGYGSMVQAGDSDWDEWQTMVDVNLTGVLAATHVALPHLSAAAEHRGIADVVTVSSVGGRKITTPESNVYAATKHAVGAFSEALRQEFASRHVRVGLIEPGLVRSELTERTDPPSPTIPDSDRGVLAADDVADAVLYMVTRPNHCAVNELLLRPTEQHR